MRDFDGRLVLSPTDLTKHLACAHLTTLDLEATSGASSTPTVDDEALALIFRLGTDHEVSFLEALRAQGRAIEEIATGFGDTERRAAEAATVAAMQAGAEVIYQATLYDGDWGGQADFLLRVDTPSALGDWSYEIADTKLARRMKVAALLQMATYADRLTALQGLEPARIAVVTGDGQFHPYRLIDVAAYARRVRGRLRDAVTNRPVTVAAPVAHCAQCRWKQRCDAEWSAVDDLSQVAFMRADHRARLHELGITTTAELAAADPNTLTGIGGSSRQRLVQQAALQVRERTSGEPHSELLAPSPRLGLLRLPAPTDADLYLDFEGDPYAEGGQGREYLAGVGDRAGGFTARWAHSPAEERKLLIGLLDELAERWRANPGLHVYHYAAYEVTALKRMTARHGIREAELDTLLRGEVFVDLYAVVRQGVRISKPSYSIKKLEAFYWGQTRAVGDVADAMSSVVAYERWLVERDDTTLKQIEAYNLDDVRSTLALHDWLEVQRSHLETLHGSQPRPDLALPDPQRPLSAAESAESDLADRLHVKGHPLLGDLVQWHRREQRPKWWDLFRLKDLLDDELINDSTALGGLSAPVQVGAEKRSALWRYEFPPQDAKFSVGDEALDIDDVLGKGAGTVHDVDTVTGSIVIKVGPTKTVLHARGFAPRLPVADGVLRESIQCTGERVLAGGRPLALSLLERRTPARTSLEAGESPGQAVVRLGRALDGEVLAVQGPPGTGKTTVGAELIRALLDDGKRVGVVAQSHAVIGNLLTEVGRPALQRCNDEADHCGVAAVERAATNDVVVGRLTDKTANLVGGTAWLWSRPDLAGSVDVLVVDEAGQFSLANTVAVSRAAGSLVLLGDPQQLAQPSQATHPGDAGVSALEYLLDGHDTMPADRGVFLDTTWRMHPQLAELVGQLSYDGRLRAGPGLDRHRIQGAGRLDGSGPRFRPVDHEGCSAASDAEVGAVRDLLTELNGAFWFDHQNVQRPLSLNDVLIVAPYNVHVGRLRSALPTGARVGTVDKFQGQQAPVVIYTMASSSADDAPRGVDFLYDTHRLNVAVSRAKCLAILVANPRLLDAAVHSPEQLRKVNAVCRFYETAISV